MLSSYLKTYDKSANHGVSTAVYQRLLQHLFPAKPEAKTIDSFYYAAWKGDLIGVHEYIENCVLASFPERDQAALDLAIRFGHQHIVKYLIERLTKRVKKETDQSMMSLVQASVYKRVTLEFNQNEFYYDVTLEIHKNNKIQLYICFYTDYQFHFLKDVLVGFKWRRNQDHFFLEYDYAIDRETEIRSNLLEICMALNQLKKENFNKLFVGLEDFFACARNNFPIENSIIFDRKNDVYQFSNFMDYLLYQASIEFDYKKMMTLLRHGANPNSFFSNDSILETVLNLGVGTARGNAFVDTRTFLKDTAPLFISNKAQISRAVDALLKHTEKPFSDHELAVYFLKMKLDDEAKAFVNQFKLLARKLFTEKIIKNLSRAKRTLEVLFEYGANPFAQSKTMLHHLIKHEDVSTNSFAKEFYRDAVTLLPASNQSWRTMLIHHGFTQSLFAKVILDVNKKMQSLIDQQKYIVDIDTMQNYVAFNLKNESKVSIETKSVQSLSENQRLILAQFFEAQSNILIDQKQKSEYFENELKGHAGKTFVDIIKLDNKIVGVYVYEYIKATLNGKPTFIHYIKLAAAKLEKCPELIKFIILMRSFVCHFPNYNSVSFGEAASEFGFNLGSNLKRYPAHQVDEIDIEELTGIIKNVKPVKLDNEYYYIKDGMSVPHDPRQSQKSSALITLSYLSRKTFNAEYYRPGHALCIAFLNNDENFQRFKSAVLPIFGEQVFMKLFSYYAKFVNEFIATPTHEKTIPMRAKL